MNKQLLTIFAITIFGFASAKAQDVTPTPTPSPTTTPTVSPTPAPDDTQNVQPENLQGVPAIAPNYQQNDFSLPDLGRVGVDMMQQKSLTLREAITMALENNKDIEVTRQNVRSAEFDLQSARGFYEPRFAGQTYYERAKVPIFSFFGGGPDGSLTTSGIGGNVGITGGIQRGGGQFSLTTDSSRGTTNNSISLVNPTYTQNLGIQFTQPLFRGRRFDQGRLFF